MKCHSCERSNRPESRFCGGCGKQLAKCCSRCGFSNRLDEAYCGGCGALIHRSKNSSLGASSHRSPSTADRISTEAIRELNTLREKAAAPKTQESAPLSQEDIERMMDKKA